VATVRLEMSQGRLQAALTSPGVGLVYRFTDDLTTDIRTLAVLYAPVRTGRLRGSITPTVTVRGMVVEGRVGSDVNYAAAVHEGVRNRQVPVQAHGVRAHTRKGSAVRAYTVSAHTRQQKARDGRPFIRQAMDEVLAARGVN
jgi:hypothetical protein